MDIFHAIDNLLQQDIPTEQIITEFEPVVSVLPTSELQELVNRLLDSGFDHYTQLGLDFLALRQDTCNPNEHEFIDETLKKLEGSEFLELFFEKIIHPMMIKYPFDSLELIDQWNTSVLPFHRSASLKAFGGQVASTGEFGKEAMKTIEALIYEEDQAVRADMKALLAGYVQAADEHALQYVAELEERGVGEDLV
jgi:hypothetical protein